VQCVAFKGDLQPETFDLITHLPQESSVIITGSVREDKRAPGLPGGYEVGIKDLQVVQAADVDYPMSLKDHGPDFALDNRHLWIRMQSQWAILRVRVRVMSAVREYLDSHGFFNLDTPILTPAAAEGTTTLFETEYFDEGSAYLAQTGQLYNEANIFSFGKVYSFGPTFRAEKSKTRRHLTEFWMLEPEIAFCDLDGLMEVEEGMLTYIVQSVLKDCSAELKFLERDISKLENVVGPFPRMSYDDAAKHLIDLYEKETDPEKKELLKFESAEFPIYAIGAISVLDLLQCLQFKSPTIKSFFHSLPLDKKELKGYRQWRKKIEAGLSNNFGPLEEKRALILKAIADKMGDPSLTPSVSVFSFYFYQCAR